MRVLMDSGQYAPSLGNGYVDYTQFVLDGTLTVEDSINVPTLTTFQLSANQSNAFKAPLRSTYVKVISDIYYDLGVVLFTSSEVGNNQINELYPLFGNVGPSPALTYGATDINSLWFDNFEGGVTNRIFSGPTTASTHTDKHIGQFGDVVNEVQFHAFILTSIYVPAPGTYTLTISYQDGFLFAIPGATFISGTNTNNPTVTPLAGYSFANGGTAGFNQGGPAASHTYVVSFPRSGYFDLELDWASANNLANVGQLHVTYGAGADQLFATYGPKVLATGFVTNQPEPQFLGLNPSLPAQNYQQLTYEVKVTSDEWLLNCQAPPYIPAFVNQTDAQILTTLAEAMMPGFFVSITASGTLIPYYQYDPSQTWSDIAKTFADQNRYWYKVINKKFYYYPFGYDIGNNGVIQINVPAAAVAPQATSGLGIKYDETIQKEKQLFPLQMKTSVVSVPPVNDCTVLGDVEPQVNWDNYFIGDGFTSNFQLKHQVFQGVSSDLLQDDWTEAAFTTGSWIVNDPTGSFALADTGGHAVGALNIIQKGHGAVYTPIQNATFIQAQNGLELGGGLNLQHGQVSFNDTASGGGGLIGGIFTETTEFDPGHCLAGFKIQGQPNIATASINSVSVTGGLNMVALGGNGTTTLLPGNVGSCSTFVGASFLNGQLLWITAVTQNPTTYVLLCSLKNQGVLPGSYGPASDSGHVAFSADGLIITASGAAGIYMYPLYNGSVTGSPVVSQPNHQYVLQTWIGAEAPNRFTRPYTNLTQTATYGAQNLAASGAITWVVTDVNLGNYVIEQQFPLFGLFPAAPPPVVTKFSAIHQTLPPFAVYVLASGVDLNVSINYTDLSLPPQGYLTVQSLSGASGGNLPWLPSQLSIPIVYQLGFGMANQTAQVSQQGEAFALSFYTDDIPSVGARIRFQSWSAGQSIARVQDQAAIAFEGKVSGDSGIRSAILSNLSPLPRTSAECEAAAGAAILDREYPQWQGSYTIQTGPYLYENLFSPSMYNYPHTGMFMFINSPTRGVSGQNFFVNTVRYQVVELRQEVLVISLDYGPDLYLEKLLPSFLEREQNLLVPKQTVPPPNPITLLEVLNASLPTFDSAQVLTISNSVTGNNIVVDLSGGKEANASTSNGTILAIGASGCEVRYVDNGWGIPNQGRVGVFTVDQFVLPRTTRDQTFYLRGIGGPIGGSGLTPMVSRFSKALRVVYPLVPSSPTLVKTSNTQIVFDYAGDVRDIYGLEVRAPTVSGAAFVSFAPNIPEDIITAFTRVALPGTPTEQGNGFAYYGDPGSNGLPWKARTAYAPGAVATGKSGATTYKFQAQITPLPYIMQQDGSPIPNTITGDFVNLYYWDTSATSNPGVFTPFGSSAASANFHTKVNSLLFNIGGNPNVPMLNFILNYAGEITTYNLPWGGAQQRYSMVALFSIYVSVAGNYNMLMNHDDGAFFGMSGPGTVTRVSGPNTTFHVNTSMNGYPVIGGINQNGGYSDNYVINFPVAGRYDVEVDYFQWENEQNFVIQFGDPTTLYTPLPVPAGSFPQSMTLEPAWPAGLGATVTETDNGQIYNGPFGTYQPLGGAVQWKNVGAVGGSTPPPFQYQAGDIVYLACGAAVDFTEIVLVTAANSTPAYNFAWFDYGRSRHTVGTVGSQGNVGTSQLIVRGTAFNTVSGSISSAGVATVTTNVAHNIQPGQFAILSCAYKTWPGGTYGPMPIDGAVFCGIQFITATPSATTLQFNIAFNPYPAGLPTVQLLGLGEFFPENPAASGGIILQRPIFAPADLTVDLTQPDIASALQLIQASVPGGRINGLEGLFFNLTWDYSNPTVVPSFAVPTVTGIVIDETTQQVLWGIGQGTPDGYRVEVMDYTTGTLRNKYTIDHISNNQLLKQLQMTAFDFGSPSGILIKVTPFDSLGDGIPQTIAWQGAGGGGGTGDIIVVSPPLTEVEPAAGILLLGITDFVGDTGAGGLNGTVPAPPAGSASGQMFLSASGFFAPLPSPPQPYDMGCTFMGALPSSGAILHLPMVGPIAGGTTTIQLPANLVGSEGHLLRAPAGSLVLGIYKNGILFGTMTFAAGNRFATFSSSAMSLLGGGSTPDVFIVLTPTIVDASASDLGFIIRGTRTYLGN